MLRAGGSELALVSKLKTLHDDNQRFFVPDKFSTNKFGVRHYAEPVAYTVDGWCERNRDALHADLVRLMKKSSVASLFETDDNFDPVGVLELIMGSNEMRSPSFLIGINKSPERGQGSACKEVKPLIWFRHGPKFAC